MIHRIVTATALGVSLAVGAAELALAASPPFSFNSVEFLPADQREPAARAFVSQYVQPGTNVRAAVNILKEAGAFCRYPHDGVVECTHSSFQRHPGNDLTDVTWRVKLNRGPDGAVTSAHVTRTLSGL